VGATRVRNSAKDQSPGFRPQSTKLDQPHYARRWSSQRAKHGLRSTQTQARQRSSETFLLHRRDWSPRFSGVADNRPKVISTFPKTVRARDKFTAGITGDGQRGTDGLKTAINVSIPRFGQNYRRPRTQACRRGGGDIGRIIGSIDDLGRNKRTWLALKAAIEAAPRTGNTPRDLGRGLRNEVRKAGGKNRRSPPKGKFRAPPEHPKRRAQGRGKTWSRARHSSTRD